MCGIAGLMTLDGSAPPEAVLSALLAALAHRGPDGDGRHVSGDVGMVQARLAIIDLATGDQPLYEPGGGALVANGEIYNYLELRAALDGARIATGSDCEPPLHLYRRHGLAFTRHLRGMYAIAIHDPQARRLVLARDPFGIKPLYYAETARGFSFASEPQALVRAGLVEPEVDTDVRAELLQLQFSTGTQTIFRGIHRLRPGETLAVAGGRIVERFHRAALPEGGPTAIGEADALARLDAALEDSVRLHQRSDVPYGLFLSGGVDSTAVLAMMARLAERPVRAFTVGFPGTGVADERDAARRAAAAVGAEHVEVEFTEADFWRLLPAVAAAMDDPAADYATLPTFKLAAVAGQELKVVLSGEGGDELFAGYGRYRSAVRPWWLGGRLPRARGIFDRIEVLRTDLSGWRDGIASAEVSARGTGRSRLQVAQAADCADWLPNDLLTKLDRCLMAHGVEGRTPFVDPEMAALAFALPDTLKIRDGRGKYLLRRWLAGAQPTAEPFARKKGFTVPVGEWIHGRGTVLGPLVAAHPAIQPIADAGAVVALFRTPGKHEGFAAWTLLFYALWFGRHMLGRPVTDDVFAALAA
ncbi:asparagine synthase (glutamine-hydrolysing) [Stella humosa]|uniref:asparagine synthase (glutamine-hydrolyzing) n=1 Tax=Stella humosa TaxID=94 RepID=A0A3N1M7L3_9PROT|nr:asparagine synthase (glutamine-hydrolyzing) [Stella humosa]ROP99712.1 asparagine synthase (glutamine-hydrolysing) [Stella humosa]BBK31061.1 asparagine synthetase B [Stella humosa]